LNFERNNRLRLDNARLNRGGASAVSDESEFKPLLCGVCCGEPISGKPCICGGAGTQEAELKGFRELTYDLEEKLHKIRQWCEAYPLDVFPEPDFKEAARVLKENGMTLDSISASNMRHVLTGIKNILDA